MMDKKLKTRWIKALRSGKYPQATNGLRTETGYCCLGVLCDLIDPSKWNDLRYDGRGAYVPGSTRELIGLSDADENKLAAMNDNERKSFEQIAAYIEKRKTL